ncbi:hypothetical protein LTR01_006768 [Friedmanniomyces endolithicus]|nr:hypothetical protein LTR01_006768 [Friedmanniomyces endolithicus]
MRQVGSVLWPKLRVLQVYGANTGVGKTIFSSILCRAFQKHFPKVHYLKPVSTGPLEEADDRYGSGSGGETVVVFTQTLTRYDQTHDMNIKAKCLYQFSDPVSPHIAARLSKESVTDDSIQAVLHDELSSYATSEDGIAIVETAGGVMSPAPSGISQADLYRPFRLPVLLVGDHQLGGISTTISAWESLHVRGYDVQSVALFSESRYDNHSYLKDYFAERDVLAFSVPPPPERHSNDAEDARAMQEYYEEAASSSSVAAFSSQLLQNHDKRMADLQSMSTEAVEAIWHPFMQHSERSKDTITAIDSAYGDYFATHTTQQALATSQNPTTSLIKPAFDASASWWTQGLGHGNPRLALTAAHAAGRYGHVMFASAVHEPALRLAQTLLTNMGNPRLAKVFYTDNGSAGMEVAVKMGIRAAAARNGWSADDEIVILGLKGSYHGDTMGTMDCSEPSIYNKKEPWYTGRGHWLDFPQVKMRKGRWIVESLDELKTSLEGEKTFDSLDDIFDFQKRTDDYAAYKQHCDATLAELVEKGTKFGALVMEPILLGAGGMMFADPLFQRCLVDCVRHHSSLATETQPQHGGVSLDWTGMPVICDEIFTGLYRLGRFSASSFLGVDADIVANAKLLTGGVLPLCTTTASQAVFDAFVSEDKTDALLHGHSYTAHPVGCSVANESLRSMMKMEREGVWVGFKGHWSSSGESLEASSPDHQAGDVWSMWSEAFVKAVSHRSQVDSVFALGSVLAITLKDPDGKSYASKAAYEMRDKLLAGAPGEEWVIHSRVLGNVWYAMAAMTTTRDTIESLEEKIFAALE